MIGYGDLPSVPISLIDFHGYNDDVIPYDLDHSEGNKSLYIAWHWIEMSKDHCFLKNKNSN